MTESIDLPKSFSNVYGVGPGSQLDSEIQIYMKSQGWPERVQVGLLIGNFMENISSMYDEERRVKKEQSNHKIGLKTEVLKSDLSDSIKSKYAGFN